MVRVMQINAGEIFGGVSSMIYNFYQNIDRKKIQFDFVAPNKSSYEIYRKEIETMGGRIFELKANGPFVFRKFRFWKRLYQLQRKEHYDIVHINSGSLFFHLQVARIAKMGGAKKIIVHSHNAGNDSPIKAKMQQKLKLLLEYDPTHYFACSHKAAQFMFCTDRVINKNYQVINNGINLSQFSFSKEKREKYRFQMGLNGKKVLLHVGRFSTQKNHTFLLHVFSKYHEINLNSVLLLVGEGELQSKTKAQAERLGVANAVYFLGFRTDIAELMHASDIFLLPSLYEGLPVVGIEAQASGLPCVMADTITRETDLTGHMCFLSIEQADQWVHKIRNMKLNNIHTRKDTANVIVDKGYSLSSVIKQLEDIYFM